MHSIIKLVREMTPREKAYFRKLTKIHPTQKQRNYLKIYETINKNESIDLHGLKQKFKGTTIYKHFSSEMNYLFEQIMRSLLNYNLNTSNAYKVLKNVAYIEILLSRGNKTRAAKLLNNAKSLAYHNEDFPLIIKLIELEEQILFKQGILNFIKKLEALREERLEVTQKIENINELRVLKERIRDFQYSHIFIDTPAIFPDAFNHPLLSDQSKALSLTALDSWHYAHVAMAYVLRSYDKGIHAAKQYFSFLKQHQYFFSDDKLLPVISNLLLFLSLTGDKTQFYEILEDLSELEKKPQLDQPYIGYIRIVRLLELSYRTFDLTLEKNTLLKAEHFLATKHTELAESHKEFLFFRATRACIDLRAFKKAQEIISFWYQQGGQEFMMSNQRMLKLIILYELNWSRMLEAEIAASYKILRRHKQYNKLEKVLIRFFRKIIKNQLQEKKQLVVLEKQLEEIKRTKEDNKLFEYFNYHRWCLGRMESMGLSI